MPAVDVEYGPYGHACDPCGTGIVWETEGVRPGVGRGYGDHERLLRWRDFGSLDARSGGGSAARGQHGAARFRLVGRGLSGLSFTVPAKVEWFLRNLQMHPTMHSCG